MGKTRLIWVDSLKGWLMLLVVMGHAIQYCMNAGECESNYWWNLIYSFHMPAFMALSGFVNFSSTPPPSPSENGRLGVYHRGQNRYHDST